MNMMLLKRKDLCGEEKHSRQTKCSSSSSADHGVQRRVSFDPQLVRIRPIIHVDEYTQQELEATWYQVSDYKEMENACDEIVIKVIKGVRLDPQSQCGRGLESKLSEGMDFIYNRTSSNHTNYFKGYSQSQSHKDALRAVLAEQARQNSTSIKDEQWLANVYMIHTKAHADIARRMGLLDRAKAKDLHDKR